ncbi:MAG: hypothetical protein D6738_05275 [Acidobacteria bacterium]|nr:MAG: hypothetical protein D6738_05275 [Acidobacteriota bacterium]
MSLPLIEALALLLERTYDTSRSVRPVARFVVGDEGHRRLTERRVVRESVDGAAARLLLRRLRGDGGRWAAALYLPDAIVARLERYDPRRGLGEANIDEFFALVEEVDHLVTFADRAGRPGGEVSLLELEWHAAVSQYLVGAHFLARLAGRSELDAEQRAFLEHHLFDKRDYEAVPEPVRSRYRKADRLARGFLHDLYRRRPADRLCRLRRFHHAGHHEKLRTFAS